jgi:hypothetical protein
LNRETEQAAQQEERNYYIEKAGKWRDEMERILHNTQEELEFYNFKLTIKEQMLESATDDVREERKADVDQVRFEIRWINTRINDEKASLSNAQNNYDYEVNYDASVRSQQEFDASNEELINRRIEREGQG